MNLRARLADESPERSSPPRLVRMFLDSPTEETRGPCGPRNGCAGYAGLTVSLFQVHGTTDLLHGDATLATIGGHIGHDGDGSIASNAGQHLDLPNHDSIAVPTLSPIRGWWRPELSTRMNSSPQQEPGRTTRLL